MLVQKNVIITLLILVLSNSSLLLSQVPDWNWAIVAGSLENSDDGKGIGIDSAGNSYVSGRFTGTIYFGSDSLISRGNMDVFVAKINPFGNWIWAKQAGGTDSDQCLSMCVDSNGDSYIIGTFKGQSFFGNDTLNCAGYLDIFVAKIDTDGNWLWAREAGGGSNDEGNDICMDENSDIFITGYFIGTAYFGDTMLSSTPNYNNTYVAKLNSNGIWQWAQQVTMDHTYVLSFGICSDDDGNAIITGKYYGTPTFGSTTLNTSYSGGYDVFVAKISPAGVWIWAKEAGYTNYETATGIGVDNDGNSYITGYFSEYTVIGGTTLQNSDGSIDIFVAKLDANGNWLWAKKSGGESTESAEDICVNGNSGTSYLTGFFRNDCIFGTYEFDSYGYTDIFVTKIDTDGNWLWAKQAGGSFYNDEGHAIALDLSENLYLTGLFWQQCNFGTISLISYGYESMFVAKIGNAPLPILPGDIIINEIMINPSAVDDSLGEYVELYNTSGRDIDINGWILQDNDSDYHIIDSDTSLTINTDSFLVIGINADSLTNGGHICNYQYEDFNLDEEDEVLLKNGSTIIDSVIYNSGLNFPNPVGASIELDPVYRNAFDNDNGEYWYAAHAVFGLGDFGTPGSANPGPSTINSPENVSISLENNTLSISWDIVPAATSYKIYSSSDPYVAYPWNFEEEVTETNWSEEVVTKKFYYVTAVNQE